MSSKKSNVVAKTEPVAEPTKQSAKKPAAKPTKKTSVVPVTPVVESVTAAVFDDVKPAADVVGTRFIG